MASGTKKNIFVVTHGDKHHGANPSLTPTGVEQNEALRSFLPHKPEMVISGTGKRHLDVATALGLTPNRYTATVGGPDSLEMVGEKRMIILANGSLVNFDDYTTLADTEIAIKKVVTELPHNSVICAGRPSMIMLGKNDAKNAAVYEITVVEWKIMKIIEIHAIGEIEAGTV